MLLRLYSIIVLALDIVTLLVGIWFAIILALYRTFKPPALKNIHGEIALVVGAGRGIGREIAIQLAQLGVQVACIDKNIVNCQATVNKVLQGLGTARFYMCDVTNEKQVIEIVHAIREELGEVTMLFHCYGVSNSENPIDIRSTMDVAILSYFYLLDSVFSGMQGLKKGHIVVLSSVAGLSEETCQKTRITLSSAQFATQGFAESLYTELRHSNSNIMISLVHIYPFIIESELTSDIRLRMPSYFGTMLANDAAKKILDGVRRNYNEFSIPGYLLFLRHILRILPKKASFMLRDFLDTGVDFA